MASSVVPVTRQRRGRSPAVLIQRILGVAPAEGAASVLAAAGLLVTVSDRRHHR